MNFMDSGDSDPEITGNEYEELCKNCDKLCKKIGDPVLPIAGRYKKDSRVWLHKNPGFRLGQSVTVKVKEDSSSECLYSVMDMFGRKYKKDSRTWLHKSSRKRQRLNEESFAEGENKFEKGESLPNVPKRPPAPFIKRDLPESPLRGVCKTGYSFNRENSKQYFTVSNIIRKRKRQKQLSYSANNSPNDLRYNEEICRILSDELNGNNVRGTVSEEMFEIFDDEESLEACRRVSDHTPLNVEWRETRSITSETSTQSSNDNQQIGINQSPLSSDASINISSEVINLNKSPRLISTATNHYDSIPSRSATQLMRKDNQANLEYEITPPGSPWSLVNSQTDFSTNSCPTRGTLHIDTRKLNINSRSVCLLIAESDEFLAEDNLLVYEEESDDDY